MIKALIFDFDGVVLESVDIKTDAFRELFQSFPKHLPQILEYHVLNGGVSRREKIKYFYREIIKEPLAESLLNDLCNRFQSLVMQKVIDAPFVAGAKELLEQALGTFKMFVISGTPQDEMRLIVERRNLKKYFVEVFGSPELKTDLTRHILDAHQLSPQEVIFIGDAITDFKAAQETGVFFIARNRELDLDWIKDPYVQGIYPDLKNVYQHILKISHEKE